MKYSKYDIKAEAIQKADDEFIVVYKDHFVLQAYEAALTKIDGELSSFKERKKELEYTIKSADDYPSDAIVVDLREVNEDIDIYESIKGEFAAKVILTKNTATASLAKLTKIKNKQTTNIVTIVVGSVLVLGSLASLALFFL